MLTATWWMKKMSTPRLASPSPTPAVTERVGTKTAPSSAPRMVRRTSRQNTKVAMNVPSTTWLAVSRMKVCSSRGPSCDDASASAVMVMEKVTPAVLITDPATTLSTARAPSGPPE